MRLGEYPQVIVRLLHSWDLTYCLPHSKKKQTDVHVNTAFLHYSLFFHTGLYLFIWNALKEEEHLLMNFSLMAFNGWMHSCGKVYNLHSNIHFYPLLRKLSHCLCAKCFCSHLLNLILWYVPDSHLIYCISQKKEAIKVLMVVWALEVGDVLWECDNNTWSYHKKKNKIKVEYSLR